MDDTKFKILFNKRYRIHRSCGLCKYGTFADGGPTGTCHAPYAPPEGATVSIFGKCWGDFQLDKDKLFALGELSIFLKE